VSDIAFKNSAFCQPDVAAQVTVTILGTAQLFPFYILLIIYYFSIYGFVSLLLQEHNRTCSRA
jgi:hypothetical protein